MFERFTDRARRVCVIAAEEARQLNHDHIGPEHLLLGLTKAEGVAAAALAQAGIGYDRALGFIEARVGRGVKESSALIPYTPQCKKVLELSQREALQLGHSDIGTEHVLLAIVRDGEGVAAELIISNGVGLNRMRQQVIQVLAGSVVGASKPVGAEKLPPFWEELSVAALKATNRTVKVEAHPPREEVKCSQVHAEEARLRIEALTRATATYGSTLNPDGMAAAAKVFEQYLRGGAE